MALQVTIKATDDDVRVFVKGKKHQQFVFEQPGMLTGYDLHEILTACGITTTYDYED